MDTPITCKHWLTIEAGQVMQVVVSIDPRCPLCRAEAAESALAAMTKRAEEAERKTKMALDNMAAFEEHFIGTGAGSGEEFLLKELAMLAVIDEVEALRRGIGFTHVGPDPILMLKDKWLGLMDRKFAHESLLRIRSLRENRAEAARGKNG